MGIKNRLIKAAVKTSDAVAKLSALSPEQLELVDEQREKYLSEMPDPTDPNAVDLTNRLLSSIGVEIYNAYLPKIKDVYIPIEKNVEYGEEFNTSYNIRYFNITKWVTDKKENSLEKLVNVYEVLSNEQCNIALVFHRMMKTTEVYMAVVNTKNARSNNDVESYKNRLMDAIRGNFPGAEWNQEDGRGIIPYLNNKIEYSVATASNIPTEKSEKFISQTIEKLLDGIIPDRTAKEYTLILLATPIDDAEERKLRLGELYSCLAPYASWQTDYRYEESDSTNSSATMGVNLGVSAGVQNGTNSSITNQEGTADTSTQSQTESSQETLTDSESITNTDSTSKSTANTKSKATTASGNLGINIGHLNLGGGLSRTKGTAKTVTESVAKSVSNTVAKSVSETTGKALTNSLGRTVSKTVGKTAGIAKSASLGANLGASFARSSSVTATIGRNEGISQSYTNYNIKHALEMLEQQMKRYEKGTALGMWDFAAYVLSEDQNVANNVAHSYLALTQGEESFMSQASINLWRGDMGENSWDAREICGYLRELRHPLFGLNPNLVENSDDFYAYPTVINATTSLSGKELAYSLNFPQKSVAGLPVLECAEFGRNVVRYDEYEDVDELHLGKVFHMNHKERNEVKLSKDSLTSHVFITGSTGSGKSNTIFTMLDEAMRNNVKFLVVEPAKGEYKSVFGRNKSVSVYGTNPNLCELLRLNPFSFPEEIHVLEHIDRLVEIFNVCWPMYAAMPAVLKDAIVQSYKDCGWDLLESSNTYGDDLYPCFRDVSKNVRQIIDSSEYDSENKGAYKGSLLTRLQSLTNGINGLIFNQDEIEGKQLFDTNVIVDLSRVGSSETKSLIMGMLVLKLQEYRMTTVNEYNTRLKHLTVLEEAHNILKRTSTEQTSEGANLLGKSVEMISNAIAEMRTYGEGFIIADQAPGLLDMSAIRNTNTKIIMRLPDQNDRELVGRAANLNDDQITEIAKLPKGVGAVYQNEWVQPVLCKVDRFEGRSSKYQYYHSDSNDMPDTYEDRIYIAELLCNGTKIGREIVMTDIRQKLRDLKLDSSIQVAVLELLTNRPKSLPILKISPIMDALFPDVTETVQLSVKNGCTEKEWTESAEKALKQYGKHISEQTRRDIIQSILTYHFLILNRNEKALSDWFQKGGF